MDSAESTSCRSRVEIETEEQRDKRLQRRRERERERRASESEEMREDRLSKRRAGDRARRASESAEMREKRLSKRRAGDSARRASLSGSVICAINAFPECRFARRTLFGHHFLLRNQCANLTQRPGTPVRHYSLRLAPTMIIICLVNAIYVHKGEDATPPTYAMDERKKKALRKYHPKLRTGITVSNFLPDLHKDAEGFLTDVEMASIADKRTSGKLEQVDELIEVLLRKEDKDFDYFCDVLERNGCEVWSRKLKVAAGLGKQPQLYCC